MQILGFFCFLLFISQAIGYSRRYNYYNYFQPSSADRYTAMSDIDWGKRSYNPYAYTSMADYDWGWKKRAPAAPIITLDETDLNDDDTDDSSFSKRTYQDDYQRAWRNYYNYNFNRNNNRYNYDSYDSKPIALASRRYGIKQPRQYQYHSMADVDWGLKKKRTNEQQMGLQKDKKHIGSLAGLAGQGSRSRSAKL